MERFGNTEGEHKEPSVNEQIGALVQQNNAGRSLDEMGETGEQARALRALLDLPQVRQSLHLADEAARMLGERNQKPGGPPGRLEFPHETAGIPVQ